VTEEQARRRFAGATYAHLASADVRGRPHLVPLVFVLCGETIYSAVDAKPKRTRALRRLANIAANPHVAVLVDHYSEDWDSLWWVRADGTGRVLDDDEAETRNALALLRPIPPAAARRSGARDRCRALVELVGERRLNASLASTQLAAAPASGRLS
jgi:PPOX class probable F420-dependent enzyme